MTFEEALTLFNNSKKDLRESLGVTRQVMYHWRKSNQLPELRKYQIKEILSERESLHTHSEGQ